MNKEDTEQIAEVEDALYKSAMSGNTTAQIFYLKNRDPEKWKDKQDFNHSSDRISFNMNFGDGH